MPYGLTLAQVRRINRPQPFEHLWGTLTQCTEMPEYSLFRVELTPGGVQPLHFLAGGARHIFVQRGDAVVRRLSRSNGETHSGWLREGAVLPIEPLEVHGFASTTGAELYLIGPPGSDAEAIPVETSDQAAIANSRLRGNSLPELGQPTTGKLDKYWGRIETIVSGDVAGKRIFVKQGGQSSLEFHVEKRETYWIQSGLLKVGLRVGRAENHSIVLKSGESYDIRPGVMHMRIALEDTTIIEVSTRDSDADSHLVEDGEFYRHVEKSPQQND